MRVEGLNLRGKEEKGGKLLCKYVKNSALFINKFLGLVIGNKCDNKPNNEYLWA